MFAFGDGFDLYAATADALAGYWDGGNSAQYVISATGRFSGSQSLTPNSTANTTMVFKNSGSNDAVHHINFAFKQTAITSGSSTTTAGIQLLDNSTAQCTLNWRQDGAMELRSGGISGSVLATWATGYNMANVWITYEVEIVIDNAVGSIAIRRNGNTSPDFSASSLNTRVSSNSYANRFALVTGTVPGTSENFDDLLWRSDPSSVSWIGDVRCWTRIPASDGTVQFTKSSTTAIQTLSSGPNSTSITANVGRYSPFTAAYTGTIGTISFNLFTGGYTGNMKCAIYASSGSVPTTVLGTATPITNPVGGANNFTFGSPVSVTQGTQYWLAIEGDSGNGSWVVNASNSTGVVATTTYASFPASNPAVTLVQNPVQSSVTITYGSNAMLVSEAQQDTTSTYVYDSNVGDNDLYNIASSGSTVSSVTAVTTRGFVEKSDAGARGAAMQIKSGATTVQSTATLLSTSFGWLYRTDLTDPNTTASWVPANVDSVQIGPIVTS